ncbi:MAG: Ig-like domain-containing protein [Treponema sp.]|nr:Ig-like domain-containing protein [Treponema sp.]
MKTNYFAIITAVLVVMTSLAGCFVEPSVSAGDGKGYLKLQFASDAARTILPPSYSFSFFQLNFTQNSNGAPDMEITNSTSGVNLSQLEIVEGGWKLDVKIFLEAGRTTQIASANDINVNVIAGQTVQITVYLVFGEMNAGTGTFTWNITSTAVTPDLINISLIRLDKAADNIIKTSLTGNDAAVPAGHYLATVRLDKDLIAADNGARRVLWSDVLHIYQGQTTNLVQTFTSANYSNNIKNVWLIVGSSSYLMTEDELGYFETRQNMAASNTFAFSLSDPAIITNENNRAMFVPAANNMSVSASNTMTFIPYNITANKGNKWTISDYGSCDFLLNPVDWNFMFSQGVVYPVKGVSIPATLTMNVGGNHQLVPTFDPFNATNKNVSWSVVSGTAVSVAQNGTVTANSAGTATVRVTTDDGGFTADCTVTVRVPVTGVTLSNTLTLYVGDTHQLTAVIAPANATNQDVTWSIASGSAVTVSTNGTVTANNAGTATVRVTTADGNFTANCTVTVYGKGNVNVQLTVTDQGAGLSVPGNANPTIYKSGTPGTAAFTLTNPVSGHTYTWYINDQIAATGNSLNVSAANYSLGYYTIRLVVQEGGRFWSMPGNLSFTVRAQN